MRKITASIDPAAIGKVSRFFDATNRQIIDEMLQNARRAGAKRVDIRIDEDSVTITDDGRGIADAQTLLAFGRSGWSDDVHHTEDPAGMGFFSLARRTARVSSRVAGTEGWRIDLEPAHFTGDKATEVRPAAGAPAPHGTHVTFSRSRLERNLAEDIANAARHCPLAVTVDGETVEREDFLHHAVRVTEYEGVRIGVFHGAEKRDPKARSYPHGGTINFHGIRVACPELPTVVPVNGPGGIASAWRTAVDIVDCPRLELVLPTRHKAVDNEFLLALTAACRRAIYHAILEHGGDIRLNRNDQLAALVNEIPIPTPPAELRPWEPERREDECTGANHNTARPRSIHDSAGGTPLVMEATLDPAAAQVTARALEHAGLREQVFEPTTGYAGYDWYDDIERITDIEVTATFNGATATLLGGEANHEDEHAGEIMRAERVEVTLQVSNRARGTKRAIVLRTDVAFTSEEPDDVDQIGIVLSDHAGVETEELAELMMSAFFSPSIEGGGSYESQREDHETEYARIATEATASPTEAREQYLVTLAETGLLRRLLPGESITIERNADNGTAIRVTLSEMDGDPCQRYGA